ncbi:MAG TPA: threonine--tRNA ligase [Candidatus Saccharimonadales bacterium]|nr:threonine--tRNA ligase [Candidatus Saccharimonadales bacterium]
MEKLETKRHSLAHLLAAAVKEFWPQAHLAIGPAIDNGFYYDIDFGDVKIVETDLKNIAKKMAHLAKQNLKFERADMEIGAALEIAKKEGNPYKTELISDLMKGGETNVSFYTVGKFTDLCRGPHVESTKEIKPGSFKLHKLAGAYWRGDEKNKMLTRIYGLAFDTKEELDEYLKMMAEAEKRDHRKLGKELGLFVFSDLVGPGLPLYTHKGALIRKLLIEYSNELQSAIGYQEVHTPNMNKAELFKVSGHYEKYKEDMFRVVSNYSDEEYFLKPMNCPQHTQIYASQSRSYKELPIRIADFANLYRDERPGELNGLSRLRCFCQDDGHSFCREDQIKEEFVTVLEAIKKAMATYEMKYKIRLSLWDPKKPEKYLGEAATWEKAQKLLEEILVENKIDFSKAEGEAAIYGPKMDLISNDSLGREWQISTIQLDFIMPQRFSLEYTDMDGQKKTPVMIHRAIIGSPERFMSILIEHYAGNFPLWLAPVQVKIISVSETHIPTCQKLADEFKIAGIRVEIDDSNETVGNKIRKAANEKVPHMLVIGDKETAAPVLSVRDRGQQETREITKDAFIAELLKKISERTN